MDINPSEITKILKEQIKNLGEKTEVSEIGKVLSVGDEIEARVVKVDASEHRIGLSIKAAKVSDEEFKVEEDMLEGLQSNEELGDLSGAFSEALNDDTDEWHPGDNESKKDND